jgi:hypothetical protein
LLNRLSFLLTEPGPPQPGSLFCYSHFYSQTECIFNCTPQGFPHYPQLKMFLSTLSTVSTGFPLVIHISFCWQ